MIKFSIITINYNNLSGLHKTMKSVFEQTYEDIEYIIIDGGSNDGSAAYIKEHADLLTYWVSEPDNGVYHAMNKGIDLATGSYLLFLNSGDWLSQETIIEKVAEIRPTAEILYGDIYLVESDGEIKLFTTPKLLTIGWIYKKPLHHQAVFYRLNVFKKFGKYDESYSLAADWEHSLRLFLHGDVVFVKIDVIVSYYDNAGQSRDNREKYLSQIEMAKSNMLSARLKGIMEDAVRNERFVRLVKSHVLYRTTKFGYKLLNKIFPL